VHGYELIATATFGLESVVADEVKKLGYEDAKIDNGKVTYRADLLGICRSNMWLRSADRVRLKVGEFQAETFDSLFEQVKALPWEQYLPADATFPVEGKSIKSTLYSVSDCQAIVKKAVVEKLKLKYQVAWFAETGPRYTIEVALLNNTATLTIDTSGPGLHKRGYRTHAGNAPIKETLAAALLTLSKWYPDTPLIDPFCGSGTIPIEAALLGLSMAPGYRREFVSEKWPLIPEELWRQARQEAQDMIRLDRQLEILGADCDPKAVQAARLNARAAGVEAHTRFEVRPLAACSSTAQYGKIICNPPYGERLGERGQLEKLYQEMGMVFSKLDSWSYYIITAHPDFEKLFGRSASKKRKLYNGDIKVDFFQYFGPRPPRTFFVNTK